MYNLTRICYNINANVFSGNGELYDRKIKKINIKLNNKNKKYVEPKM